MAQSHSDLVISGGGLAGLIAALAFADRGFSVVLVSPDIPASAGEPRADLRSTAFLQPAVQLFERIGLWPRLAEIAVPLEILRIVDSAGSPPQVRDHRDFKASDLGLETFGWNLLNCRVAPALLAALAERPEVELRIGRRFHSMVTRESGAVVRLDDGTTVACRLVVAADGRDSAVREAAGIGVERWPTGQKAQAFTVTHPIPHQNASTEIYRDGGPFTLVPLPDQDGRPASAVVWMEPARDVERLAALPPEALSAVISERSCHWLGPLTVASEIRLWPIVSQRAKALTAERTAIIAEAAHVMPPIGAQGLNTSLNDLIALLDVAEPEALGSAEMLRAYERRRAPDIRARVAAIDLYNRVTRSGSPLLQGLRLAGLRTLHGIAPLRHAVMRAGMGG